MSRSDATYTHERPGPLEVIHRLAGRSSFTTPHAGRGGLPGVGSTEDIAHALSKADDRLGAALALAAVCPGRARRATLEDPVVERIQQALVGTWRYGPLIEGAKVHRIRIGVEDVLGHLLHHITYRPAAAQRARRLRSLPAARALRFA